MNTIPSRRTAPSVANLVKYFGIDKDTANKIRLTIQSYRTAYGAIKQIAHNQWVTNYGVEDLIINPYALPTEWENNIPFSYINTGDTYSATLIAKNNRIFISCWGDEYERLSKRMREQSTL